MTKPITIVRFAVAGLILSATLVAQQQDRDSQLTFGGQSSPQQPRGATAPAGATSNPLDPAVINPILDKMLTDVANLRDALNNPPCSITLAPSTLASPAAGATAQIKLSALVGCKWTVTGPSWLTVTPSSGTGDKTLAVQTAANTATAARTDKVFVNTGAANQMSAALPVTQEGAAPPPPPPPPPTTGDLVVPAGGDVQKAIDSVTAGHTVWLLPGVTYKVNLALRKRTDAGQDAASRVTIRTQGLDDTALKPGVRVTPVDGARMAKLVCDNCLFPTIYSDDGADGYNIVGVEFTGNPVNADRDIVIFGYRPFANTWINSTDQCARNITFDRVFMHAASDALGGHRAILMDGVGMAVINSDLRGFRESGRDSQAIGLYQCPGPYLIQNNYLEASGENFMSGGNDPTIPGGIPSDITFRLNTVYKPLAWKTAYPSSVKNLFELKNARRVLIEYNTFENIWADAQAGSAILFTIRNQYGKCNWCTVRDVTFQYNILKNVANFAFNTLAIDDHDPTVPPAVNIRILNNVVIGTTRGLLLQEAAQGFEVAHNTMTGITNSFLSLASKTGPVTGLSVHDNVWPAGSYGIVGNNTGQGIIALDAFATGYKVTGNIIEARATTPRINYPTGNTVLAAGTLLSKLDAWLHYTGTELGTDGQKPGADIEAIKAGNPLAAAMLVKP